MRACEGGGGVRKKASRERGRLWPIGATRNEGALCKDMHFPLQAGARPAMVPISRGADAAPSGLPPFRGRLSPSSSRRRRFGRTELENQTIPGLEPTTQSKVRLYRPTRVLGARFHDGARTWETPFGWPTGSDPFDARRDRAASRSHEREHRRRRRRRPRAHHTHACLLGGHGLQPRARAPRRQTHAITASIDCVMRGWAAVPVLSKGGLREAEKKKPHPSPHLVVIGPIS